MKKVLCAFLAGGILLAWWLFAERSRPPSIEVSPAEQRAEVSAPATEEVVPIEEREARHLASEGSHAVDTTGTEAPEAPAEEAEPIEEELFELWFWVTDPAGDPVEDAVVTVESSEGGQGSGRPREEDGAIRVGNVPRGRARVEVRAAGFATYQHVTLVPWSPPRMEWLELEPSTTVVCDLVLEDGAPFEGEAFVTYWLDKRADEALTRAVVGPSFRIDDVGAGLVHLVAGAAGIGTGPIVSLAVELGVEEPVVLVVPVARKAVEGRVVSASDGRPLQATVALAPPEGVTAEILSESLPSAPTGSDGRFHLSLAIAEASRLLVRSEGFATRELALLLHDSTGSTALDLGEVALEPAQPLAIRLTSQREIAFENARVFSQDGKIPLSAFDEQGLLLLDDYAGITLNAWIELPDGDRIQLIGHIPDERRMEIPLDGLSAAIVDFRLDAVPEGQLALIVHHASGAGYELRRILLLDDLSPARVEGLPGTPVQCTLQIAGGPVLGRASASFAPGEREVRVTVGAGRAKSFRIVDEAGLPLAGADLYVAPAGGEAVGVVLTADTQGRCASTTLPAGELLAYVNGPATRTSIPIEDGPGVQVIEVEQSATLVTSIELGGLPLPGAVVYLVDPRLNRVVAEQPPTDASGRAVWRNLHPGSYHVQVNHPDAVKLDEVIEVPEGETLRVFRLQRP